VLTAAVAAAVSLFLGVTAPPRAIDFGPAPPLVATGAYHVHTDRSDGTGTVDDIAAAAARAGLQFVIFTDHGDATRVPDPPAYRHGVLTIDAVEVNTSNGHVVALGLGTSSPYPLAGHPRDVVEDIHRMGGTAVSAHPDSPSDGLRWRGPGLAADGIEWLNVDSEWRDESAATLVATAARALIRGPESIASLFSRPGRSLDRLDAAARQRPAFGLAALDAHASIAWRDREEPRRRSLLRLPAYETMFRTVAQSVPLDAPLSTNAAVDADRVLTALREGRSFSIVRAYGAPASLVFTAEQGERIVPVGGRLSPGIPTTFRASVPEAPGARLAIFQNGRAAVTGQGSLTLETAGAPGAYRVEVTLPEKPAPWILSNPIVLASPPAPDGAAAPADDLPAERLAVPAEPGVWSIEREPTSSATLAVETGELHLSFGLAGGPPRGQYVAIAAPIRAEGGVERVQFVGRASRPMRISLQLRLPGGTDGRRWRRSVYLGEAPSDISIRLEEFEPVEPYTSQRPVVAPVQSLLFVVDTLNTLPGTSGSFWISNVQLVLRQP
jgi:hypothetical protein